MNRHILIIISAVGISAVVVVGVILLLRSGTEVPPLDGEPTQVILPGDSTPYIPRQERQSRTHEAVRAAFQTELDKDNQGSINLYATSLVGDYALQAWGDSIVGGQAVLKYEAGQGRWVLIKSSGGAWSTEALMGLGLPQDIAAALVANMSQ